MFLFVIFISFTSNQSSTDASKKAELHLQVKAKDGNNLLYTSFDLNMKKHRTIFWSSKKSGSIPPTPVEDFLLYFILQTFPLHLPSNKSKSWKSVLSVCLLQFNLIASCPILDIETVVSPDESKSSLTNSSVKKQ